MEEQAPPPRPPRELADWVRALEVLSPRETEQGPAPPLPRDTGKARELAQANPVV